MEFGSCHLSGASDIKVELTLKKYAPLTYGLFRNAVTQSTQFFDETYRRSNCFPLKIEREAGKWQGSPKKPGQSF
jgi:hypothetical protein